MYRRIGFVAVLAALCALAGCQPPSTLPGGQRIEPPFALRGEAEGLLLVWFDAEGLHTAARRSDIPAERREHVRVDELGAAREGRLVPDLVYVADLRRAGADGAYPVRRMTRAEFEARVTEASGAAERPTDGAGVGVQPLGVDAPSEARMFLDQLEGLDLDDPVEERRRRVASLANLPLADVAVKEARDACVDAHRSFIEAEELHADARTAFAEHEDESRIPLPERQRIQRIIQASNTALDRARDLMDRCERQARDLDARYRRRR